jgi:hypothetical protein
VTVASEQLLWPALIVNLTFLLGVLFFSVVLGVVSEDIKSTITSVKGGNFPVVRTIYTKDSCLWYCK